MSGQVLESVDDPIIGNESSEFERIAHYCRQQPPLMHSVQSNVDTVLRIKVLKIVSGVPVSSAMISVSNNDFQSRLKDHIGTLNDKGKVCTRGLEIKSSCIEIPIYLTLVYMILDPKA